MFRSISGAKCAMGRGLSVNRFIDHLQYVMAVMLELGCRKTAASASSLFYHIEVVD